MVSILCYFIFTNSSATEWDILWIIRDVHITQPKHWVPRFNNINFVLKRECWKLIFRASCSSVFSQVFLGRFSEIEPIPGEGKIASQAGNWWDHYFHACLDTRVIGSYLNINVSEKLWCLVMVTGSESLYGTPKRLCMNISIRGSRNKKHLLKKAVNIVWSQPPK